MHLFERKELMQNRGLWY